MSLARTNLTLPRELLTEVDAIAGPRGRSRYVAEAVAQRVRRDRLGQAIRDSAGVVRRGRLSRTAVSELIDGLRSEESD
jgi:metal-responsive CopG/Arc/MetJ family transcriptional regulator